MSKLEKELRLFEQDLKKTKIEIENHKKQVIKELKAFDKKTFFEKKKSEEKPKGILNKIITFFKREKL